MVVQDNNGRVFHRAARNWLVVQVVICTVNSVLLLRPTAMGVIYLILATGAISALQVMLTSAVLWRSRIRGNATSMLCGALVGLGVPIGMAFLIAVLSWLSWFSSFATLVGWAIVGCAFCLFGGGLVGGAWLGRVRWTLLTDRLQHGRGKT